jgi:transposase-like protein
MTLADQAAMTGHDGQVGSGKPARPKRRTFTMAYKARIVAAFDELPGGGPGRGQLLRREGLYHSHIEDWRRQLGNAAQPPAGKGSGNSADADELALLRAENKKLKARNQRLETELGKTKTALDIAGKAFALLEGISGSADSGEN